MSMIDVISDHSYQGLEEVPQPILEMFNLKMLYLDGNHIKSLPDDLFTLLPKLVWLDVRGNSLTTLPLSIKCHKKLENLLLQNNQITHLPNELGLVPNLKVLQLKGNPVEYPPRNIIENGVDDILIYLKQEYYKNENVADVSRSIPSSISDSSTTSVTSKSNSQEIKQKIRKKFQKHYDANPLLVVKSLSKVQTIKDVPVKESDHIIVENTVKSSSGEIKNVHKILKDASRISVLSHIQGKDSFKPPTRKQRIQDRQLKDMWLEKLRHLLEDQEKIIQQEKNLKALSTWRFEKKMEPPRESDEHLNTVKPFDTDPLYDKMPSRHDLSQKLDHIVHSGHVPPNAKKPCTSRDFTELLNNVVHQLDRIQENSTKQATNLTAKIKLKNAEEEIAMILDLHKRIAALHNVEL